MTVMCIYSIVDSVADVTFKHNISIDVFPVKVKNQLVLMVASEMHSTIDLHH